MGVKAFQREKREGGVAVAAAAVAAAVLLVFVLSSQVLFFLGREIGAFAERESVFGYKERVRMLLALEATFLMEC